MEVIAKGFKLGSEKYHELHLSLINCILPKKMTPKEVEVIAAFMSLKGDIKVDQFGATARKIVRDRLGLSYAGLSNHMSSLLEKGFLIEREGRIIILPLLIPEKKIQLYQFKLENTDEVIA